MANKRARKDAAAPSVAARPADGAGKTAPKRAKTGKAVEQSTLRDFCGDYTMSFYAEDMEEGYDSEFDGVGDTQDAKDERPGKAELGDSLSLQPISDAPDAQLFGSFTGYEFDGYLRSRSYDLKKRVVCLDWCADTGEAHMEFEQGAERTMTLHFSNSGLTFAGKADVNEVWSANIVDGSQTNESRAAPPDYKKAAEYKAGYDELDEGEEEEDLDDENDEDDEE